MALPTASSRCFPDPVRSDCAERQGIALRERARPNVGRDGVEAPLCVHLALRDQHRLADFSDLRLGERGRRFGYDVLSRALRRRAQRAVFEGFPPHKLRHTAAHLWLAHGASESGLMAMAGCTRTDMLVRYTKARASERAAHEARRLNLGDLMAFMSVRPDVDASRRLRLGCFARRAECKRWIGWSAPRCRGDWGLVAGTCPWSADSG